MDLPASLQEVLNSLRGIVDLYRIELETQLKQQVDENPNSSSMSDLREMQITAHKVLCRVYYLM
jgi:hypothetical protein